MFAKKQLSTLAVALAAVGFGGMAMADPNTASVLTADATLQAACEISPAAAINFGSFPALGSTGNVEADTGVSLTVACSNGGVTPTLYGDATREMADAGANKIAFKLSLASSGGTELSSTAGSPTALPSFTHNGQAQTVVLYGRIVPAAYQAKPIGAYEGTVNLTLAY